MNSRCSQRGDAVGELSWANISRRFTAAGWSLDISGLVAWAPRAARWHRGSAKGAFHTSPAQRAGHSDGRCQSAESAFYGLEFKNGYEWFAGRMWKDIPALND